MSRVAVIGGGLTGLATAYYLGQAKPDRQIDVFEEEHRFGGKIKTKRVDGYVVEVGPDSYLARKQAMTDLINELGLVTRWLRMLPVRPLFTTGAICSLCRAVPL